MERLYTAPLIYQIHQTTTKFNKDLSGCIEKSTIKIDYQVLIYGDRKFVKQFFTLSYLMELLGIFYILPFH